MADISNSYIYATVGEHYQTMMERGPKTTVQVFFEILKRTLYKAVYEKEPTLPDVTAA